MLEAVVFYLFAAVTVGSAVAILLSKNIVRSAVWLLGTLGAVAGLYLLLAANYLAAIQLIIYAGGILVLIVFGVMLTAQRPLVRFETRPNEVALAAAVGLVLFAGLLAAIFGQPWPTLPEATPSAQVAPVRTIGTELLTTYLVPFELVSVLLLAVMIGAAYLARPQRR